MATIVTRAGKGSPLTNAEVDANFTNLNAELLTKQDALGYTPANKAGDTFTGPVLVRSSNEAGGVILSTQNTNAGSATQFFVSHNGSLLNLGNARAGGLALWANGTAHVNLTSAGFFGIGKEVPSGPLHVKGTNGIYVEGSINTNVGRMVMTGSQNEILAVGLNGIYANGRVKLGAGAITPANGGWIDSFADGQHIFYGPSSAEIGRFTAARFFGLGTATPAHKLTVQDTVDTYAQIATTATDGVSGVVLLNDARSWVLRNNGGNGDAFEIRDATANAQRLVINTTGNATFSHQVSASQFNGSAAGLSGLKTVNGNSILGSGNIQIDGGVTSFNTRTGAVTLSSGDVTTALGFTPYNSTNPSGYITNTGNARVGVENNGTLVGTRRNINFIPGTGISLSIADDSANEEVDVTITSTVTAPVQSVFGRTGAVALTSSDVTTALGFTPQTSLVSGTNIRTINGSSLLGSGDITVGVSGLTLTSAANGIDPNNVTQNQLGYNTSVSLFGQTDGGLYSSAYSSSWIHQIYGDFRTGQIATRGKNNGTWQAWRTQIDSGNYTNYVPGYTGSSGALRVQTGSGYVDIGPVNSEWCHFITDRPRFYFGTSVTVNGDLRRYSDSALYWHSANAPRAGNSDLMHYAGFTLNANDMPTNSTGFTYSVAAPATGPIVRTGTGGGYDLQLNAPYSGSGGSLWWRTRNGDNGTWNAWFNAAEVNSGRMNTTSGSYNNFYTWLQLHGHYGLYSGINNAHFYPNASTYGSWYVQGERNGWRGLEFESGLQLMMNYNAHGIHRSDTGWMLYSESRNLFIPGQIQAGWSDTRLKDNQARVNRDDVFGTLSGMRAHRFNWNAKAIELGYNVEVGDEEIGLIAQHVKAALPVAAAINKAGAKADDDGSFDYLTINYDKIAPFVVEAVNIHEEDITGLKAKVAHLEALIAKLIGD
jgi:hypothetical protein